ncbi:hypothetical protein D9758_000948 [Tetrapyrgos nigripes]|uniref:Uncharacterized protein n=1 Tax=Tetrapyrgos nigripes TaxID=182062 RepID=A0A8H5LY03_9AGAR|nr:hypothetical protein D9758_000948 [Tetrapyrgos nigripes]
MPKDVPDTRKTRRVTNASDPLSQSGRPTRSSSKSSSVGVSDPSKIAGGTYGPTVPSISKSKATKPKDANATSKSDILIAMKPVFVDWIVSRQKTHEFRKYLLSSTVERMWMYTSSPTQMLQYVAMISHGKKPGEIDSSDAGLGNGEFNQGVHGCSGPSGYAYEIKELYELREPLKLKDMQQRYGVTFPQRFMYMPKKMLEDIAIEQQKRIF